MKWTATKNSLATALVVSLFVISISGYLTLDNLRMMKSEHYSALKRGEVIELIDRLLYAVKDAEANSRLFVITGDQKFLEAFNAIPSTIDDYRQNLEVLLNGEKDILGQLVTLDTLVARKFVLMRERIHTRQTKGFDEARQQYNTVKSVVLMEDIANLVRSIEDRQRMLQREDDKRLEIKSANDSASDAILAGITTLGVIVFFVVANREMARRAASDKALEASEDRYRSLIENSQDGIFLTDTNGLILYANPSGESMLGYTENELIGSSAFQFIHHEDTDVAKRAYATLADGSSKTMIVDFRITSKHGPMRWVEVRSSRASFWRHEDVIISNFRDVTERKMWEDQLQRSEERYRNASKRLRGLSNRLLSIQESERHRLALELHDEIGQMLTAVQLNLEAVKRSGETSDIGSRIGESSKLIEQLMDQIRNISFELRPSILDRFGLVRALRWYVDRQSQLGKLSGKFTTKLDSERYPSDVEMTCFRIAQEALTNVLRHARAKSVDVTLQQESEELVLTVADDGIGLDTKILEDRKIGEATFGVVGMRERMTLVGGTFEILSAPGQGTRIVAHIPITTDTQTED